MGIKEHLSLKNYLIAAVMLITAVPFTAQNPRIIALKAIIGIVAAVVYLYDTADTEQELSRATERAEELSNTIEGLRSGEIDFEDINVRGTVSGGQIVEGVSL